MSSLWALLPAYKEMQESRRTTDKVTQNRRKWDGECFHVRLLSPKMCEMPGQCLSWREVWDGRGKDRSCHSSLSHSSLPWLKANKCTLPCQTEKINYEYTLPRQEVTSDCPPTVRLMSEIYYLVVSLCFIGGICSTEWSHLCVSGDVHLGLQKQRGRQGVAHWLRGKNMNVLTQSQQTAGMEIQKEILLDRLKENGSVLMKADNGFILIMQADWKAENTVSDVSDDERGYQWRDQVNLKSCLIALTKVQNRVKRWNERGGGALNDVWAVKSVFIEENGSRLWATSTEGTITLWKETGQEMCAHCSVTMD